MTIIVYGVVYLVIFILLGIILPVTCIVVKKTVEKNERNSKINSDMLKYSDNTTLFELENNYNKNPLTQEPWVIVNEETLSNNSDEQNNENQNELSM